MRGPKGENEEVGLFVWTELTDAHESFEIQEWCFCAVCFVSFVRVTFPFLASTYKTGLGRFLFSKFKRRNIFSFCLCSQ